MCIEELIRAHDSLVVSPPSFGILYGVTVDSGDVMSITSDINVLVTSENADADVICVVAVSDASKVASASGVTTVASGTDVTVVASVTDASDVASATEVATEGSASVVAISRFTDGSAVADDVPLTSEVALKSVV